MCTVTQTGACVSMADVDDPDCRSVLLGLDQEARAQFALRCRAGWFERSFLGCCCIWEWVQAVQISAGEKLQWVPGGVGRGCPEHLQRCRNDGAPGRHLQCVTAPHTYTGVCGPAADFADMFDGEKAEWAAVCGVQWPEVV
mmetsp:Transcript_40506/g.91084  ORF Transcript_40506/g.91084 Transcript_40506/m.91084 type:complete len:141 (-) Transcript_40506:766-1188(-)